MDDLNQKAETPVDNLEPAAVEPTEVTPPVEDKLLAGKFKDREALIESTANLVKQVEGRDMTPTEVLALAGKEDSDLENAYKGLERQFHTAPPKKEEIAATDDNAAAFDLIDKHLESRGYVRKDQLAADKYEETELNTYFAQNPDAENRAELIKTLSKTQGFKDKSFAEVDKFITSQIPQAKSAATRTDKMGNSLQESPDDWSPEAIRTALANNTGATLTR